MGHQLHFLNVSSRNARKAFAANTWQRRSEWSCGKSRKYSRKREQLKGKSRHRSEARLLRHGALKLRVMLQERPESRWRQRLPEYIPRLGCSKRILLAWPNR